MRVFSLILISLFVVSCSNSSKYDLVADKEALKHKQEVSDFEAKRVKKELSDWQ